MNQPNLEKEVKRFLWDLGNQTEKVNGSLNAVIDILYPNDNDIKNAIKKAVIDKLNGNR